MNTFASGNVRLRTRVVAQLCLGAALLTVWELAATFFVDPFWIGEPSAIAVRLWNVFVEGDMLTHTGVTLGHAVAGLLASLIVGVPIGILFAANRFVAATLEPYFLAFLQPSPRGPRAAADSLVRDRVAFQDHDGLLDGGRCRHPEHLRGCPKRGPRSPRHVARDACLARVHAAQGAAAVDCSVGLRVDARRHRPGARGGCHR